MLTKKVEIGKVLMRVII